MPSLHFTKRAIEAILPAESGQNLYRDTTLRGFGLRVGSRSKVFFVEGQVNRRTKRVSIGRADVLSVDVARKRALNILSDMALGSNPNEKKKRDELTLEQAFIAFFKARDSLAKQTVSHYRRAMTLYLSDWRKKPLVEITRQMVLARHQRLAKLHGEVTANNTMRQLRSVYNFTAAAHEEFPPNPVAILTQARAWYAQRRRRSVVSIQDLPFWWAGVMDEPDYSRDILLIALFTGMRRSEITSLRWEYISLAEQALHIPKTKNGDPLDLPLSEFLVNLFEVRKKNADASPWVFPGSGRTGHIVETQKFNIRVAERSGVKFTLHDLRRTFITIAESLDIPHYALKRLLNHRVGGDVTGGYIVIDAERLREPVDRVAEKILTMALSNSEELDLMAR